MIPPVVARDDEASLGRILLDLRKGTARGVAIVKVPFVPGGHVGKSTLSKGCPPPVQGIQLGKIQLFRAKGV